MTYVYQIYIVGLQTVLINLSAVHIEDLLLLYDLFSNLI